MKNKSIGIFDSGFGGLNIMKGILEELPDYNYVYLGDTARVPYGNRSKEVIFEFTKQAVGFLFQNDCQLIILACNTASADALRKLQQEYLPKHHPNKKVLGVLIPGAEHAIAKTKNGRVGVIATEATIKSKAFERELKKMGSKIKIFSKACPLLVPIVEAGERNSKATEIILNQYLRPLLTKDVDTLILGCTHYGIIENKIRKVVGKYVAIVNESKIVPKKLKAYLRRHPEIEKELSKDGKQIFYSTDVTDKFIKLGSEFIGREIEVEKVGLL